MTVYQAKVYDAEDQQLICWFTTNSLKEVRFYAKEIKSLKDSYVKVFNEQGEELKI